MNSLLGYGNGSDDDSPEEDPVDSRVPKDCRNIGQPGQDDVNYDEVQMSLSEDSSDESKHTKDTSKRHSRDREDSRRTTDKHKQTDDLHPRKARWGDKKDDRYGGGRSDRGDDRYGAGRNDKDDDKYGGGRNDRDDDRYGGGRSDRDDDRYGGGRNDRDDDRSSRHREEDRTKERYREEEKVKERRDDRRGKSKERYGGKEDRYKDRKDRKRHWSPKRSRSKDRSGRGEYSKRHERASTKKERLDKMGIEIKGGDSHSFTSDPQRPDDDNKDRFFVPGITGRFREQIEKRKLLWQKKEPETPQAAAVVASPSSGPRATKVWEATTFAQDTDGKVANKFKRLMGIKNAGEGSSAATDVLKKQEEMFSSMEQQYEVARTATHTMRGVGLGFGSFQR